MDKIALLKLITDFAERKEISKNEVLAAFEKGSSNTSDSALTKDVGVAEILYYVGAIIVFVGVSILVYQNWDALSSVSRIGITLGLGLASYIIGLLLMQKKDFDGLGHAFQIISVFLLPLGTVVLFYELGIELASNMTASIISGILFAIYLLSYFVIRRVIFLLFSIFYGTFFFFIWTNLLLEGSPIIEQFHLNEYRLLFIGLTYILIGHGLSKTTLDKISWILYDLGILGVLISTFILGGWHPQNNIFWEIAFPGVALGSLFLSVPLKSKGFLVSGTLFLMLYIGKITGEYFSEGMGWPMALIICGFLMIGIGYLAFWVNTQYLKDKGLTNRDTA